MARRPRGAGRGEARRPDLILSDAMMPELDGFGLLAELRADPSTSQLPVIMLSARAGEEAAVEGLAAGADDYLLKPFSSRELIARVRANLDLAELRQAAARATERHARLLRDLADAAVDVNRAATVPEVLAVVAERARALVGAERAPPPASTARPRSRRGRFTRRVALTGAGGRQLGALLLDGESGTGGVEAEAVLTQLAQVAATRLENALLYEREHRVARRSSAACCRSRCRSSTAPSWPRCTCPAPARPASAATGTTRSCSTRARRARHRRRRRARRRGRVGDGPAAQRGPRLPARGLRPGADARARQPPARHARRRLRDARLPGRGHRQRRGPLRQRRATRRRWSSAPTATPAGSTAGLAPPIGAAREIAYREAEDRDPARRRARALHRRPGRAPQRADRPRPRAARRGGVGQPGPRGDAGRPARRRDARQRAPRRRRRAGALAPRGRRRAARRAPARRATSLGPLRERLRRWLDAARGSTPREAADVLLAVGEAASNAIEHPLEPAPPAIVVTLARVEAGDDRSRSATTAAGTRRRRRRTAGAGCTSCTRSPARSRSTARPRARPSPSTTGGGTDPA